MLLCVFVICSRFWNAYIITRVCVICSCVERLAVIVLVYMEPALHDRVDHTATVLIFILGKYHR